MNVKALLYKGLLSTKQSDNEFQVLLITAPKECKENTDPGDEEYYGMLHSVIKAIGKLIKDTKKELINGLVQVNTAIETSRNTLAT